MFLHPRVESLEARIAPAVFFLSGVDKTIVDAAGASVNNSAAKNLAGSDIAVLMQAGDTLVLDADGDHVFDVGEAKLVSITAGSGLVFATDFGSGGTVATDFATRDDLGYSVAVQSDGKILVAGSVSNGTDLDFAIARYNPNGTLDTTFGGTGKVITPIGSGDDTITSLVVQSDGKIVVAGVSFNGANKDFALARYTAAGVLDTTFNTTGTATTDIGSGDDGINSLVLQSDGKIVVTGVASNGANKDFATARYTAGGVLDTTFNPTGTIPGVVVTAIGTGNETATGVAIQSDGKIVVGGSSSNGTNSDFALVRYTAAGVLDVTFDTDGKLTTAMGTGDDFANSLAIQSDGKIILAGSSSNGTDTDFALARYTTSGALDTTFNTTGRVTAAIGGDDIAYDVTVQSDGRIVVGGETKDGANTDFAVLRFTSVGALDATFNGTGKVRTPIGSAADSAHSLVLQADGRIVLAGSAVNASGDSDFALARYGSNGILDTSFNSGAANARFEISELTGLAVSSGFEGTVAAGVDGTIVTGLTPAGALAVTGTTLTVQHDSIAGLSIAGAVTGNVFAGGSISHVRITGAVSGNLATGSAVNGNDPHLKAADVSFNHGAKILAVAPFVPLPGEAGGSIADVRLDQGAHNLRTGNGGSNSAGSPGRGGSISDVVITVNSAEPVWLVTGSGGDSTVDQGAIGGSISRVTLRQTVDATDSIQLIAGGGGDGAGIGRGGNGGSISDCTLIISGSIAGTLALEAGPGGSALGTGAGGAGGAIVRTDVQVLGSTETVKGLAIVGGNGGPSASGAGGAGGGVIDCTFVTEATIGSAIAESSMTFLGGAGGTGKTRGGTGGALIDDAIFLRGPVITTHQVMATFEPEPFLIASGQGGALKATATAKSIAGKGGAITSLDLAQFADSTAGIMIVAGDGGSASAATAGKGGAGGTITGANILGLSAASTELQLVAGNGGDSPSGAGDGGAGGSILQTTIHETGGLKSLTVQAGTGADGKTSGTGKGGVGGALKDLRIITGAVSGVVKVQAGAAGKSGASTGAAGGRIDALNFQNLGQLAGGLQVAGGDGGGVTGEGAGGTGGGLGRSEISNSGGSASLTITSGAGGSAGSGGKGGLGGNIGHLLLRNHASLPSGSITAGGGGAGGSGSGTGGTGGRIIALELSAIDSALIVSGGAGGSASGSARGGAGGGIEGVTGAVDVARFVAGDGGTSTGGTGGLGGSIRNMDLDAVGRFVQALVAGNGGNGTNAGAGGSIVGVSIPGDIGDFSANFDVVSASGQGGLVAGKKGTGSGKATNGSITNVTADRIATMIAGRPAPNAITYSNGVYKISKITATVIGADVDGDGVFDFTNGSATAGFQPNDAGTATDGDIALDGIVLVRKDGFKTRPVEPLKFQQV